MDYTSRLRQKQADNLASKPKSAPKPPVATPQTKAESRAARQRVKDNTAKKRYQTKQSNRVGVAEPPSAAAKRKQAVADALKPSPTKPAAKTAAKPAAKPVPKKPSGMASRMKRNVETSPARVTSAPKPAPKPAVKTSPAAKVTSKIPAASTYVPSRTTIRGGPGIATGAKIGLEAGQAATKIAAPAPKPRSTAPAPVPRAPAAPTTKTAPTPAATASKKAGLMQRIKASLANQSADKSYADYKKLMDF